MRYRTLADYIRARMDAVHTDSVQIERDYPDVPADWVRGLLIGRGTKQPNRRRVKLLAQALQVDEAELWRFMGRYDRIAELKGEPTPGAAPEWAIRLEKKIDDLNALLRSVGNRVDGSAEGVANLLAALNPEPSPEPDGGVAPQPEQTPDVRAVPRPASHRRQRPRPTGGARPSWDEEPEVLSRSA